MASIKYDSTELVDATYNLSNVEHNQMPKRQINSFDRPYDDGVVIIASKFKEKIITVKGILTAASKTALDTAIDDFKELMAREDKNLDVEFTAGGTYRRYVARATKVNIKREHYNMLFVPYEVTFLVVSGKGEDTASIKALDEYKTTTAPVTGSWEAGGSTQPLPSIKLRMAANWSTIKGLKFENTDTDEYIIYTSTDSEWWSGDILTIYCDDKYVSYTNGAESTVDFIGVFPKFKIGTNNFKLTAGDIEYESFGLGSVAGSGRRIDGASAPTTFTNVAQSFQIPYADDTFQGIALPLFRFDSPGDLTVRIEKDTDGVPSGSLAHADATFTIAEGDVSAVTPIWTSVINSTNIFGLSANTKYWIVLSCAGADSLNYYDVSETSISRGNYAKGNMATSRNDGTDWTNYPVNNVRFALYIGGKPETSSTNVEINYTKKYL